MAVYVDTLRPCASSKAWRWTSSAHLVADTLEELHEFARRLGLRRRWFQGGRIPHYDLSPGRHQAALERGAEAITRRELVAMYPRVERDRRG